MSLLYLSDILARTGLDLKKVKLIRHSLGDKDFKACYDTGFIKEYTQCQRIGFSNMYDYWVVFISDKGTSCKLYACYKVNDWSCANYKLMPSGFPIPEYFNGDDAYFDLEKIDALKEYENRLIIDWGKATVSWHQKAIIEKPIIAIHDSPKKQFSGYENVLLDYSTLKEIIDDPVVYESWHIALSSVYAIYLIVDIESGKQYVGSAYGQGGLLSRWAFYVKSKHGGNKGMQEVIYQNPDRCQNFLFSILQILPKTITDDEVIRLEGLYKDKLQTRKFGMNEN